MLILEMPDATRIDRVGADLWWASDLSELNRRALVAEADLSPSLRVAARTARTAPVRAAFASRGDLTPAEIASIVAHEKSEPVIVALLNKPIEPAILDQLTRVGRPAIMGALARNCLQVGIHHQPAALDRLVAYIQAVNTPAKKHAIDAVGDMWAKIPAHTLDRITVWPTGVEALRKLASNPQLWHSHRREHILRILADADVGTRELRYSSRTLVALMDQSDGHLPPELALSDTERAHLTRHGTYLTVALTPPQWRVERDEEQQARAKKEAEERRVAALGARAVGADPVLARAALRELARQGDSGSLQIFWDAMSAQVLSPQTILAIKPNLVTLSGARHHIVRHSDPVPFLDLALAEDLQRLRRARGAGLVSPRLSTPVLLSAVLSQEDRGSSKQLTRAWILANRTGLAQVYTAKDLCWALSKTGPRQWPHLTAGDLRNAAIGGQSDLFAHVQAWMINELGKLATAHGVHAGILLPLVEQLSSDHDMTLGTVLDSCHAILQQAQPVQALPTQHDNGGHRVRVTVATRSRRRTRSVALT